MLVQLLVEPHDVWLLERVIEKHWGGLKIVLEGRTTTALSFEYTA